MRAAVVASGRLVTITADLRNLARHITPAQSLLVGFTFITLAGTILLALPVASAGGFPTPFIDALFTSTSAVTTTGLIVVDTGSHYSLFGQIVVLALFQIGGLGYMTFVAMLVFLAGSRPSLAAGMTVEESIAGAHLGELKDFVKSVILFTAAFEVLGAVILSLYWASAFPAAQAVYLGLFHAVSAFCTAGFGLFSDSFMSYRDSLVINLTIAGVTIAGGIGFFVLRDLWTYLGKIFHRIRPRPLSTHTRLTLVVSAVLMIVGSALVFVAEPRPAPAGQRALDATFQALSASTTTGFNSVDIGRMSPTSLFGLIVLMFIGASPGGTGGGIKTTTLGVVLMSVVALWRGHEDADVFGRRLPLDTVYRALAIGLVATVLVTMDTLVLTATEQAPFLSILFEVVSAFGTVGLSMGLTPDLSIVGKLMISLTMLLGRLGPLAVGFALVARPKRAIFRCAQGRVFVG
ncbi:MAG: Trk family potassium uptake protein [Gemmatimonadetes bacterium]|nr:Trk family potassium uptake protein [Gemmatimonadota bacterium]